KVHDIDAKRQKRKSGDDGIADSTSNLMNGDPLNIDSEDDDLDMDNSHKHTHHS
ncbi:hypothetical protein SARC_17625, partial [Sphaeroforma arctica JP610]